MPREDTRPTGHTLIDRAALSGEARKRGQPVRSGDLIAEGRGPGITRATLEQELDRACCRHGADVVSKALCVESKVVMRFAAWVQAREHASRCEVAEASAAPRGQDGGGHGLGIPVPSSGLLDGEVVDLLNAIMDDPRVLEQFGEWLTFVRSGV